MVDLANRAIGHGVVGFQHQIDQNVSNGDGIGTNGCQIHGEAFRLWTLALRNLRDSDAPRYEFHSGQALRALQKQNIDCAKKTRTVPRHSARS